MMMKYYWKHFWESFEQKAKAIFGEEEEKSASDIVNDPTHIENIKELRGA